jgi:hypothetical protein
VIPVGKALPFFCFNIQFPSLGTPATEFNVNDSEVKAL